MFWPVITDLRFQIKELASILWNDPSHQQQKLTTCDPLIPQTFHLGGFSLNASNNAEVNPKLRPIQPSLWSP